MLNPPELAPGCDSEEAASLDPPLRVEGFRGTAAQIERQWYEEVYRGRGDVMPQLTWRALLMGTVLGGVLALTNLYIGLKAGWSIGVTITACIVSYGLWSVLLKARIAQTPMTILENNCMQSTASAAGYSTAATLVSAFSAYYMINQHPLPIGQTLAWVLFVAMLGVTMAIPMKRQMVNVEQLRFPTGIASAETLRALYSKGPRARQSARGLSYAAIAAAIMAFWSDGLGLISARLAPFQLSALLDRVNQALLGPVWMGRTVALSFDPIFIGAGVLMGLRPAVSILLGGTLCWCVFVPVLQHAGVITGTRYADIVQWTVWGGVSCMVAA